MLKKSCPNCKTKKELKDFYVFRGKPFSWCKECRRYLQKLWIKSNKEKIKKYHNSVRGRESLNRASRKAAKKYPEKWAARAKLRYWVKTGKIAHLTCETCGNFLSEAHHPDYSKPLDIWWLCKVHHKMADKRKLILYV